MFFFVVEEAQRGLRAFKYKILNGIAVDYTCFSSTGMAEDDYLLAFGLHPVYVLYIRQFKDK